MILRMELGKESYDVVIERGVLSRAGDLLDLRRKVLIVTDEGVPAQYAARVAEACAAPVTVTVPQGEGSKSLATLERLLAAMPEENFTRSDAVVAVGGGVVGDLAGFAASCYMRGIDFYNIPTTLLSQVDSSIGGKTAVNLNGVKNCVGAFYQPKKVLIDPAVLSTLPPRQLSNGMAEAIKMILTFDAPLFERLEREDPADLLDELIEASLRIKAYVVERDVKEALLRRVLNFGHTLGHGIESSMELQGLYHGECVALGMLPMCDPDLRPRLRAVLQKAGLPVDVPVDLDRALEAVAHDKKLTGAEIHYIWVPAVGQFEVRSASLEDFKAMIRKEWKA